MERVLFPSFLFSDEGFKFWRNCVAYRVLKKLDQFLCIDKFFVKSIIGFGLALTQESQFGIQGS